MREIKTVKRACEVEWRICDIWTIMNGITEITMILAAKLVQRSVLTPEPGWKDQEKILKTYYPTSIK